MSSLQLTAAQGAIDRQFDYESMFTEIEQINRDNQIARPITKQSPMAMKSAREAAISFALGGGFGLANLLIAAPGLSSLLNLATIFTWSFAMFLLAYAGIVYIMMPHRMQTRTVGYTQPGQTPTILPQPLSYSVEAQPDVATGTVQAVFYQHLPELSRTGLDVRKRPVLTRTIGDGDDIVATTDAFGEIVGEVETYNQTLYTQYEDALQTIGVSSGEPAMVEAHFSNEQKSLAERNRDNAMLSSRLNTLNDR